MLLPSDPTFFIMGIDQSLSGTGVAVVEATPTSIKPIHMATIGSKSTGMKRLDEIVNEIVITVEEVKPILICMEDVTRMATSASIIPLTELFAVIKFSLWKRQFPVRVQNQSQMKKFNFGQGNVSKDSNYMLRVFDAVNERFADDNQADAFMHARLGIAVIRFLKGWTTLVDYSTAQQEVLLATALKHSGFTQGKFKKLTVEEKMKLVLESATLS